MGLISKLLPMFFGSGRNVIKQTAEVFRENAEAGAVRQSEEKSAALNQFGAEFALPKAGWFDRLIDGVNRLPRPAMALGTLGMFIAAMVDPLWFASRMQGIALVPEPLWWLLGVIVSFYFGARHQFKGQIYRRTIAQTMADAPKVVARIEALEKQRANVGSPMPAANVATPATSGGSTNPALDAWRRQNT